MVNSTITGDISAVDFFEKVENANTVDKRRELLELTTPFHVIKFCEAYGLEKVSQLHKNLLVLYRIAKLLVH